MQGMVLLGVMAAIAGPPIARQLPRHRVARAADVVAGDLELAFALAARQRKPMRVTLSGTTYTIADRVGGTVRHRRRLGPESEYRLQRVTFSANPVDVFPSGVTSSADTVTLTSGSAVRRVVMTAAGKVGILR
ncbi:MAG TPA: GspH/FimT family protein [Gemmatimonadales bacterium]|nr:GspH/FimT family protein [Gemmatimonadales bacterium]